MPPLKQDKNKSKVTGSEEIDLVKVLRWYGVDIEDSDKKNIYSNCPFCGKEGKFSVIPEKGQWRCLTCNSGSDSSKSVRGGNVYTFLNLLHKLSLDQTHKDDLTVLARDRGLLSTLTLTRWGICKSIITGEWLVPAYNSEHKLVMLYRYIKDYKTGKSRMNCAPNMTHGIFGLSSLQFDSDKPIIKLLEGPWDAMALEETLRFSKEDGESLRIAKQVDQSLILRINVLALPSCNTFNPKWAEVFNGKDVYLGFDSDHPKTLKNGIISPSAGYEGMKRVTNQLALSSISARSVKYLHWGDEGYNPNIKSGSDIRDWLTGKLPASLTGAEQVLEDQHQTNGHTDHHSHSLILSPGERLARVKRLESLLQYFRAIPEDWVLGRSKEEVAKGSVELIPLPCHSWKDLVTSWRKAMNWSDGLDKALASMLACIISTEEVGDPIWLVIMAPPSSGKTALCEALSVARQWVIPKSTIRGFHSGYKTDKEGTEDHSLVNSLIGKTLIIKDGDTLMKSPNVSLILSEARDIFDGASRTHYRHGLNRDYENIRITIIICGTASLRQLDSSDLGARFIHCIITKGMDEDTETEIGLRVLNRALRNVGVKPHNSEDFQDPAMTEAKRMTGGYIQYLKENLTDLMSEFDTSNPQVEKIVEYAQFVAFMRARPSDNQDEIAEREFSFRLVEQYTRMAVFLAVVTGKKNIDDAIIYRVKSMAIDTSEGKTFELTKRLARLSERGASTDIVLNWLGYSEKITKGKEKDRSLLLFLRKIGVIESFIPEYSDGMTIIKQPMRYRLTERLLRLYQSVMEQD